MKIFNNICNYLSKITTIDKNIIEVIFLSILIFLLFAFIKFIAKRLSEEKLLEEENMY